MRHEILLLGSSLKQQDSCWELRVRCGMLLVSISDYHLNHCENLLYAYVNKSEPRCKKTLFWGFLTRSDTNWAVQPQKIASSLKFRI